MSNPSIKILAKNEIRFIGADHPAFIIAEAGSNHNQSIDRAKKLIDVAAESGADAVKFQLFRAAELVGREHPAFDSVKNAEMPRHWLNELVAYSKHRNITFLATPFDREAIDLLCEIDTPFFKWASSETTNLTLLDYAASKKKPIFLSTGMCDLADVQDAVSVLKMNGIEDVVLLQCVSNYPTRSEDVNLRVMDTFSQAFQYPVGFSDHSLGIALPSAAVARGACVIEKHFTLNRNLLGPDHFYAVEPKELATMISYIREVEAALGSPVKVLHSLELEYGRRDGLYATHDLEQGTQLQLEHLKISRPAHGVRARFRQILEGKVLKNPILKNSPVCWDDLI